MSANLPRSQGKSMFVKEILNDNPRANAAIVNEAWRAAGMSGSISAGLVNHLRYRLGLSGNLRNRRKRGKRAAGVRTAANGSISPISRRRSTDLLDLEAEIDQLLMKAVEVGQLSEVEDSLRKARRHLYSSLVRRS